MWEWLTELRKTVYLLNYWFTTKIYGSGITDGRAAEGKECGAQAVLAECSGSTILQHLGTFGNLEAVQISQFMGFIMLT